jgi:hypothetical protein
VSLPGLTGQSSTPGRCLLDRPVKPGDDSQVGINLSEKRTWSAAGLRGEARRAAAAQNGIA